jgi:phosphoribosylaminoimidazole (AIR) synthetase
MWEVFNMGTGFCCVVAAAGAGPALDVLRRRHRGAAVIGEVTGEAGVVRLPDVGLTGDRGGFRPA